MNHYPPKDGSRTSSEQEKAAGDPALRETGVRPEMDPNHGHNFLMAIVYQCCLRVGWIFKTESIILPAVLDVIGGSGWLRGCLPMLNRLGQSVPPLLASDWIRNSRYKKQILVGSTAMMGLCFVTLSLVWVVTGGNQTWYLPLIFLLIYGVFFASTGINMLVLTTLIGKIIQTRRRGSMSLWATVAGAALAVTCAIWLLGLWLEGDPTRQGDSRFDLIFGFTGLCFLLAAFVASTFREPADNYKTPRRTGWELLKASVATLRQDRNFLLLATITFLFGMSVTLFPHYQRLARDRFDLSLTALIPWVIAQNIGAALISIPAGWIADRLGTRLVLRCMMLIVCIAPVLSLVLVQFEQLGRGWFTLVFGLLGLVPVTMRMFNYYTLEVAGPADHPKYLSTMSIALAVPSVLLGSLVGAMIDWISFEFVFILVTLFTFTGWMLTWFLAEPRHAEANAP